MRPEHAGRHWSELILIFFTHFSIWVEVHNGPFIYNNQCKKNIFYKFMVWISFNIIVIMAYWNFLSYFKIIKLPVCPSASNEKEDTYNVPVKKVSNVWLCSCEVPLHFDIL